MFQGPQLLDFGEEILRYFTINEHDGHLGKQNKTGCFLAEAEGLPQEIQIQSAQWLRRKIKINFQISTITVCPVVK